MIGTQEEEAYIKICFSGNASFMRKLNNFLKADSNMADMILKHNRDLLLQVKHIPNKRLRSIQTKNLEELCEYVDLFFKQNAPSTLDPFLYRKRNHYLDIAEEMDNGYF